MANPNIVNVTSILGKTVTVNLTTTASTLVVENAAASGKIFKINTLIVSNVNAVNPANITINLFSQDNIGGTGTQIASTIAVPANASLVVISKDNFLYLEEDRSIGATAAVANELKIVCSYEEIS